MDGEDIALISDDVTFERRHRLKGDARSDVVAGVL